MNESNEPLKRGKGGRPPKNDPATHRYSVNLSAVQNARLLAMYEQSGVPSIARFIAARIFDEPFRVITTDRSSIEFVAKLTALHGQIRSVGTNYNQVVKELHSHFSEKKALALLYKLEQETISLSKTGREVLELCRQYENR